MPMTIRDLPGVMRTQAMPVGAVLMDRWFAAPAWTMSDAIKRGDVPATQVPGRNIDSGSVRMHWALACSRARVAHDRLLRGWRTPDRFALSRALLARRIATWRTRHGVAANAPFRFGNLSRPVAEIDGSCQIALERVVSGFTDPVDDFYAALGTASFKLAVEADVAPIDAKRVRVTIVAIGTYLRDTYDFNGDQPLGSWGRDGFSRMAIAAPRMTTDSLTPTAAKDDGWLDRSRAWSVGNDSFREWRQRYGRGGDFLVFSDIRRIPLAQPIALELPA